MDQADFARLTRIAEELKGRIITARYPLTAATLSGDAGTKPYHQGDYFGRRDGNYDLNMRIDLPAVDPKTPLVLTVSTRGYNDNNTKNPQLKLFVQEQLVQAFDVNHRYCKLEPSWVQDGALTFRLQVYAGDDEKQFPVDVSVGAIDSACFDAYFDFMTYLGCWRNVDDNGDLNNRYHRALNAAAAKLDFNADPAAFTAGLQAASALLHDELDEAPDPKNGTIYAVGHTHIDMAWLWPIEQTVEKANRSFATVLHLMKEYPEFSFMHSSPQLYQWIKEKYPSQYAQIKQAVRAGQWHPEGAMWVEPDTNLPSGESLVRQALYGKRFFKQEFGIDSKVMWLPDVFGYSAALPQILKKAGIDYFMTTKLAWNDTNLMPASSFYWQGIDGSRVVTHMINTISEFWSPNEWYGTYSGLVTPNVLKKSWDKYRQKPVSSQILVAYGWGDGGGGPTFEMLEYLRRFQHGIAGMPQIKSTGVREYFDRLAADFKAHEAEVPTWQGEMYLEFHRGTYTSVAKNKHNNRRLEHELQTIEKLYATQTALPYPHDQLNQIWQRGLLNQFHDVLPGSSIKAVYDQTDQDYAQAFHTLAGLRAQLGAQMKAEPNAITVYNPLGQARELTVTLPLTPTEGVRLGTTELPKQQLSADTAVVTLPAAPLAYQSLTKVAVPQAPLTKAQPLGDHFETADLAVHFDAAYRITSLIDRHTGRELVPAGQKLNALTVYQDLPTEYDAWNIDATYKEQSRPVTEVTRAEITEAGPVRTTLTIAWRYQHSTIEQQWHFLPGTTQIQIETHLDWQDAHTLLRSENAVAVNAASASYDIQFGNLTRPVNRNTTWEQAKFEVPAQQWADLSDDGAGLSILTNAKYGYDATYQHLGLTLHKCATFPDATADIGADDFTYVLYPHAGTWRQAHTAAAAAELNTPPVIWTGKAAQSPAFLTVDEANVRVDTVKRAEDSGAVIVRAYENENRQTTAQFHFAQPVRSASLADLLGNALTALTVSADGHTVTVPFRAYELQTVKVTF